MSPREIELIEFGPEHFDQLIEWSPTPEFLLQWAGPSMHFPLDRIDKAAGHAWLMRILVGDPADRGRGLGQAIAERLVRVAFHTFGLERIYLHVVKTNESAIRLYESLGFEACDPVLPRPDTIQAMVLERMV